MKIFLSLRKIGNARKNYFDFSTTVTHGAYTIFKIMPEFMLKSPYFCCSLLSNFTSIWSCIENSDFCFDLKNCIIIDLNCLTDLVPRMEFPKLFNSLTQTGKKEYLKLSVPSSFKLFLLQLEFDN